MINSLKLFLMAKLGKWFVLLLYNTNKWNIEIRDPGWVNNELQAYTDKQDNIYIQKNNFFSSRRSIRNKENDYGRNISIIMIK